MEPEFDHVMFNPRCSVSTLALVRLLSLQRRLDSVPLPGTKINLSIYPPQFLGGLIRLVSSLCCHGNAGVSGGGMWGGQSPHEVDRSHDQGRWGLEAPLNTYSE